MRPSVDGRLKETRECACRLLPASASNARNLESLDHGPDAKIFRPESIMIELHYWPTPNGHKITLFLEEAGLPYTIKPVNIGKGEQFEPAFLQISPNNRMPAIVDTEPADGGDPISVFESGAILQYLAEKTGRFLPMDPRGRTTVMEWLFWQVGGLGPMLGQNHHFNRYAAEKIPYAIDRYVRETRRLYGVLDKRLEGRDFIAGGEYSIADMAAYPWIVPYENQGMKLEDFPNLKRWFEHIRGREATRRAYAIADTVQGRTDLRTDEEARRHLFAR
jgi:GST-like protein